MSPISLMITMPTTTMVPTMTPSPTDIGLAVFLLVVMIVSLIGNVTVIFIILNHYQMRTHTNSLVASLSISDLIPACFILPTIVVSLLSPQWEYTRELCIVYGSLQSVFAISSTLNIMIIAVDRVIAMVRPTGKRFTSSVCGTIVALSWSVAILFSMPWFYTHSNFDSIDHTQGLNHCIFLLHGATTPRAKVLVWLTLAVGHMLPIAVMLYSCLALWRSVRSGDTKIRPVTIEPHVMIFHGEMRTAITVIIMVTLFIVCWTYFIVEIFLRVSQDRGTTQIEDYVALSLCWTSSAVKPVLYVFRNPHVAELLRLRKPRHKCSNDSDHNRDNDSQLAVVSEEQVQPKFDWAVVTKSPVARKLLLCGSRKDSDLEMFSNVDRTDSEERISTICSHN